MDMSNNLNRMLQFIDRPGFIVKDKQILYVNSLAAAYDIQPKDSLTLLLRECTQAYETFTEGMLSVTVYTETMALTATVEKLGEYDLFLMEQPDGTTELRALALAASHLRVPLSGLMNSLEEENQQAKRMASQLHRVVNNMSDAARYQNFRKPSLRMQDIDSFIASIVDSVTVHTDKMQVNIQYKGLQTPLYTQIDEELLERAILNMISNALKAKATQLQITLNKQDKMLRLTIQDNGIGVPERVQTQLFTMYQQEPSLCNTGYGLGLGMVIIQAAAKAHQGTVLMEHRNSEGFRITLTLSIMQKTDTLRSPAICFDYNGYANHTLTELSDVLPNSEY